MGFLPVDLLSENVDFITTESGQHLALETVAAGASASAPSPYSVGDFSNRVATLLPQSWFSSLAVTTGNLKALLTGLSGGFATIFSQLAYAQAQTRLATASDVNLDNASIDFFGPGGLPRAPGESDLSFAFRIRTQITLPQPTLLGIQRVVTLYINAFASTNLAAQILANDLSGGLDIAGALDGFSSTAPNVPNVTVFDQQSNPKLSASVTPTPITPPQFAILFTYPSPTGAPGFFLGRTHLTSTSISSRESYIVPAQITITPALSTGLDALVRQVKASGTIPVYCQNAN